MRIEFTDLSKQNMDFLMGADKSPREIVRFLKSEAKMRTFSQVLTGLYPGADLKQRLVEELAGDGEDREGVSRKVGNWLRDRNIPKSRETLFRICFALGFDEAKAGRVLSMTSDNGIHYRNARELTYAYALRRGYGYAQAVELYSRMPRMEDGEEEHASVYTEKIRGEFAKVDTDEELLEFFQKNSRNLGVMHNTAYAKFCMWLTLLQQPDAFGKNYMGGEIREPQFSLGDVVDLYLRMAVPLDKKSAGYDMLQRVIKKYWPNSRSVVNMRNRKEDVSRKALLLLYLVTEMIPDRNPSDEDADGLGEDCWDESYDLFDDGEDPKDEEGRQERADLRLENRLQKMNLLLETCGMSRLDPCCPFDFLVLYSLKTQEETYMSDRMREVTEALFESDESGA